MARSSCVTSTPVPHDDTPAMALGPIKIENELEPAAANTRGQHRDHTPRGMVSDPHTCESAAQRRAERLSKMRRANAQCKGPKPRARAFPQSSDTSSDSSSDEASRKKIVKEVEREKKLQARKIRNRLSAALSRKRKADRIEELEGQVAFLVQENARLRGMVTASLDHSLPAPKLPTLTSRGVSSLHGAPIAFIDAQCTNSSIPAAETALPHQTKRRCLMTERTLTPDAVAPQPSDTGLSHQHKNDPALGPKDAQLLDPTKAIDELCDAIFFDDTCGDPSSFLSDEDIGLLQDIVVEL